VDVASDGRVQLSGFDWGLASRFPYLPRVQRGRLVLAPAQWRLDPAGAEGALETKSAEAFASAFAAWRSQWSLPSDVYLAVGDNRLLLDLEDAAHVEVVREEFRALPRGGSLVLQEALPGRRDAWLPGPGGPHMTELVIPLVQRPPTRQLRSRVAEPPRASVTEPADGRMRPPGSDWLYLKLYHPASLADELIAEPVRSFAQFACSASLADAWFFIRYADPDPHLRIRFHGECKTLVGPLLGALCEWANGLVGEGRCTRFAIDTYERELERYGGPDGMRIAEAIFAADSPAVAQILALSPRLHTLDRMAVAILTIDGLLAAIGLSDAQRLNWYRERVSLSREDGKEYRVRQAILRRLLGTPDALIPEPGPSLPTSGETLTIEESMTLRARTENAGHVADEYEWSWGSG
jgi:thiopeptide-type bacteriocin biosynthesis protein